MGLRRVGYAALALPAGSARTEVTTRDVERASDVLLLFEQQDASPAFSSLDRTWDSGSPRADDDEVPLRHTSDGRVLTPYCQTFTLCPKEGLIWKSVYWLRWPS